MLVLVLLGALALPGRVTSANVERSILDIDNSLETNGLTPRHTGTRKYLHLTSKPPSTLTHSGGALRLRCEAVASPAPSVIWMKNDVPIVDYDMETNEILDHSPTSLGSVVSTLILGKPSENSEDVYTCLIQSGKNTTRASTLVYTLDFNNDISERYRLMPTRPQVVVYYKVLMDVQGSTVVLPCKAKGHPRPEILWKDRDNNIISKRNRRMKVLRSGELVISKLLWADMGEFTCVARNIFGKEVITTFVYPVKICRDLSVNVGPLQNDSTWQREF
ncbi:hypothetical protein EVAR_68267_1 [Eumeta japonica]|uniref:Hemolin n=1 Tax=Eumeta variegata TaxID=151549 RepID=A0A4C1SEY8_EUMVA|nr:hypothetical protein EVAR_68267_1 [Eumeta japonica]